MKSCGLKTELPLAFGYPCKFSVEPVTKEIPGGVQHLNPHLDEMTVH